MSTRVVLATSNQEKFQEFEELLAHSPLQIELAPAESLRGVEETGATFTENALIKASAVAEYCQMPALADDSGLVVEALNGQPGIFSARYAGTPSNSPANNDKLLRELALETNRKAKFVCVLVYLQDAKDPNPVISKACWHGEISQNPRGNMGFGYDPLFIEPNLGKTAAELSSRDKNRLSHRAKAVRQLTQLLEH